MERNSYPTLERFEVAHRELARPNNDPMPAAINKTLEQPAIATSWRLASQTGSGRWTPALQITMTLRPTTTLLSSTALAS